jgi:hypothetical protein
MISNKNWLPLDYARGRSLGFTRGSPLDYARGRGKGKKGVMGLKLKGLKLYVKLKFL